MSESTSIAYVHHTRNFWSGCTKTGPGCNGCYAEAFNRWTRGKNPETGEATNWGTNAPRLPHLAGAARDLRKWDREAKAAGERRRVFINTNSDTFDNEVPQQWRDFMWPILRECDGLDILLVTKRIGNVRRMVPEGWLRDCFPFNVRLLITVCNQEEADRDIPKLLAVPAAKRSLSIEPMLGRIDLCETFGMWWNSTMQCFESTGSRFNPGLGKGGIDWVIVGAESGPHRRPFDHAWLRSIVEQCKAAQVPCFVKQDSSLRPGARGKIPDDLWIREFPQ